MPVTPKVFARAVNKMWPEIQGIDAETAEVLGKLCDPEAAIGRSDATALGIAYLLLLQERRNRRKQGAAAR